MQNLQRILTGLSISLALTAPAFAATRTVTLGVPGMACETTCSIILSKALKKVSGVEKVEIRFEQKEVVVVYDDAKANVQALVKATTDAGYPSHEKKEGK